MYAPRRTRKLRAASMSRDLRRVKLAYICIYSLDPFDERPGLWMGVDLSDLIEAGKKLQ